MIAFLRSRVGLLLLVSLAVAAFFLIEEHKAHLSGCLPYALVALFVVFHLFMHGGHGGHGGHSGDGGEQTSEGEKRNSPAYGPWLLVVGSTHARGVANRV